MMIERPPVHDKRGLLPEGGRRPRMRTLPDVCGVVVHHTASEGSLSGVARYHVNSRGWNEIGYHFWIEPDGAILYLNDVERIVNAQSGSAPLPFTLPNTHYVAVVLRGALHRHDPSPEQLRALRWLHTALQRDCGVLPWALWPHRAFKSTICPGDGVAAFIGELAGPRTELDCVPSTVLDVQNALVTLGFDPGTLDGVWGPRTSRALERATGSRDLTFNAAYRLFVHLPR